MSIHTRGNSHRVVVKHKGKVVGNRSFTDRAEAERWERIEKAKLTLSGTGITYQELADSDLKHRLVAELGDFARPEVLIEAYHASLAELPPGNRPETQPAGPIVLTLIERFRKGVTPTKAGCRQEDNRLSQFARHPLAARTIASLTKADFMEWQKDRSEVQGKANETVNKERALWKRLFKVGRDEWKFAWPRDEYGNSINPADIPPLPAGDARDVRLSPDEEACLLRHAAASDLTWLALPIRLCLEINFRRGELLRMLRSDINWKRREMKLSATIVKNRKARRVPLTSRTIAILREAIKTIPADEQGRVFPADDRLFSRRFDKAKKGAAKEMPAIAEFRLHDTRHESISRMAMKIKSTVVLARATGHLDPRHLLRYVNPSSAELADMLE